MRMKTTSLSSGAGLGVKVGGLGFSILGFKVRGLRFSFSFLKSLCSSYSVASVNPGHAPFARSSALNFELPH